MNHHHTSQTSHWNWTLKYKPTFLVQESSVLLWFHKCLFTLNFLYRQYYNCFSSVFSHEIWFGHKQKAIQIIPSPWIISKQLKELIGIENWIKNQLFWYKNKMSFSDSISVFLDSTFCTGTTETTFQGYFCMESDLDTIKRPSK